MTSEIEIFIGWDSRQTLAWNVCARSIIRRSPCAPPPIRSIGMTSLAAAGLYRRPTERHGNVMLDAISGAPMSTEFALARFFVPFVTRAPWALFCDVDFLFRADVHELLELADPRYAVMVVKHDHAPRETVKMDAQRQLAYPRKNWSSLMLWNLRHAGTQCYRLTLDDLNTRPGLALHQFSWLREHEIGELPPEWNWLEGASDPVPGEGPKAVHYTRGTPNLEGYGDSAYAEEWWRLLTVEEHMAYEARRAQCLRDPCAIV